MEERLWSRLSELGWNTVPIEEACLNIIWLYAAGGFDLKVLRRFCNEDGSPRTDGCEHRDEPDLALRSVAAMLDEGERVGRLDFLAAPSVKTPEQIVSMVSRRFGQEPRVREARRKGMSQVSVQKTC